LNCSFNLTVVCHERNVGLCLWTRRNRVASWCALGECGGNRGLFGRRIINRSSCGRCCQSS
jgi:hypothetical protein